jgi:hypothetical protein
MPTTEPTRFSRARTVLPTRGLSLTLAALASAALVSACGSASSSTSTSTVKTNLNTKRVARSIEESILAQRHLKAQVACPTLVIQEQGRTFECTATIRAAKKPHKVTTTPFLVTIQNNRGYVTYVGK